MISFVHVPLVRFGKISILTLGDAIQQVNELAESSTLVLSKTCERAFSRWAE
jgi:hypothetical protein